MITHLFHFRTLMALLAIGIVTGTIFYSNYLSNKIEAEEREKLSQWIEANKFLASAPAKANLTLALQIQQENTDIPIIWTNENDSIIDSRNLDSTKIQSKTYLQRKLREFKRTHDPIVIVLNQNPYVADKYYYGNSNLLRQIRYFPIVQLIIVALFIWITIYAITSRNTSTQNQLWVGMAKETAHQLGTPLSSLEGWIEVLKMEGNDAIAEDMEKDLTRLKLISDRFGKIGSTPQLELHDLVEQTRKTMKYISRLSPEGVKYAFSSNRDEAFARVSLPLFDWVIENMLKNALDAVEGKGTIGIHLEERNKDLVLEVSDTGKGIPKQHVSQVFKPGYTTKKRGWGLGLTLCKRIVERYHHGSLEVKHTETGKGTTFRIVLPK